jgi:hypothetical protein
MKVIDFSYNKYTLARDGRLKSFQGLIPCGDRQSMS